MLHINKFNLPVRTAIIYTIIGMMWILFSDLFLEIFVKNKVQLTTFQTIKGWIFILVTGISLYFLLKRYTWKIHEIEERFRKTVEEVKDYAIYLLDPEGKIASWNIGAERVYLFNAEEIKGKNYALFFTEVDLQNNTPCEILQNCLNQGKYITEGLRLKKNGTTFFAHVTMTALRNDKKELLGFLNITHDISGRKKVEETLFENREEIRALMAHLESIREEERTNIAREIHDELGQILTSIKIDLSWLSNKLNPGNPALFERASGILSKIDLSINKIRKIAADLRPGEIDFLGIDAAIESELSSLEERTGIETELCTSGFNVKIANQKSSIYIYRIFQEAITNILRHSQATSIKVDLTADSENFLMTIRDNGKGFDLKKMPRNSFGVIGMNERAAMIGGILKIASTPGGGTEIFLAIPLAKLN